MDAFIETVSQILIDWGYPGLFISALLAGSIVPFSSEIVLLGLVKLGLDPTLCLISASLGNTAGGMTCYYMGQDRLDREILQGQEGKDRQDATLPSGERRFDGVLRLSARHR